MTLHIATPCHEDWSGMTPNGPGRHCASCDKTVVDLTALAPAASTVAMKRIAQRLRGGEQLCVRAHAGPDGALRSTRVRRRLLTNGMAAMLAMAMASGLSGCGSGDTTTTVPSHPMGAHGPAGPEPRALMGEACAPEPAPQPAVEPVEPVEPEPVIMGKIAAPEPVEPESLMGDVCIPEEVTPVPIPEVEPVMGIVCAPEDAPPQQPEPEPEPIAPPAPADRPGR